MTDATLPARVVANANHEPPTDRSMTIRDAVDADVAAIATVLAANQGDSGLFQQPEHQLRRVVGDFVLAVNDAGKVEGCSALHWHRTDNAEILGVAVLPRAQGRGLGHALVKACIERAYTRASDRDRLVLWLATAKPDYFARFGFRTMSRLRLPTSVIWTKLLVVFQQRFSRWLPALWGRHTFMRHQATAVGIDR